MSSPEGYEIHRELGRGATAVVYLAQDLKHDRLVALKHLQPDLLVAPTRFLSEIHTIASMQHPHILPLHDSGMWEHAPFYVMPYVDGMTLEQRIARDGSLPHADALRITCEVADALQYAHRHGVIHRDIKPANILLAEGHAYVADFGIAHVISLATSMRVTGSGMAVGTPAYMSPEQASGDASIDGRSDLYSLGCVLFEMIIGERPFRASTPQALMAMRAMDARPTLRRLRPRVPDALERVVTRALALDPGDRFQTAGEMMRAIEGAQRDMDGPSARHARRRAVLAGALVAASAAAMVYSRGTTGEAAPAIDPSMYVVLPFRHAGAGPGGWLGGDGCARLLHDAMARWNGVRLVDDLRMSDVWSRQPGRTVADAMAAARRLQAGRLAWGEVIEVGDSLEIRAVAYDVTRDTGPTRKYVVRVARDAPQLNDAFSALADSIIIGGEPGVDGAAIGTRNLTAFQAFLQGRSALARFDLRTASQRFREAATADEHYAQAHFWSARTAAWSGASSPSEWTPSATRAVALADSLPPRDRAHAAALLDLAEGRMQAACRRYRALVVADSLDFASWFGLGDCHSRDDAVVRDPRSPSGWAFRGSLHTAVTAYRRALALVPSFHGAERGAAFSRLSRRVLYTEEMRLRRGVALAPDTQRFAAFPSFVADTIAFVPSPYLAATDARARPATERAAVRWSAETYRQLMHDWVVAFPGSADAHEHHALALEAASGWTGAGASLHDALVEARHARSASGTSDDTVRRTVVVVRLLLKSDSIRAARALADSALRRWPAPSANASGYLAGLAALTGRATQAATLRARAAADSEHVPFYDRAGRRVRVPIDLMTAALQLESYAAIGGPRDSLRVAFTRTLQLIDARTGPADRAETRQALLRNAYGLAYPEVAPLARLSVQADRDLVVAMRQGMASGDTVATRRAQRALATLTAEYLPGTVGLDRVHRYAVMLLELGDTVTATRELDAALDALPRARSLLLKAVPQAAALAPAMSLRAELAWQAGDRATFERWARPAVALWSDADAELRAPVLLLGRRLAGAS